MRPTPPPSSVHFLLTYTCTYECDHCFLCCSPRAEGTFTLARLREVFDQIDRLGGVESVYFEGGEPFLYYPLLVEGVRLARARGLAVGIVTNCYWATAEEDAALWLEPLAALGLADLSFSDDDFHGSRGPDSPPKRATAAAVALGLGPASICIEPPLVTGTGSEGGEPVIGGDVQLRGRAADKLVGDLPRQPSARFDRCPHEELRAPRRVHLDPFGHVHVCQGIVMGNVFERPLAELFANWRPEGHPIIGPLLRGGPAALAAAYDVPCDPRGYVEACHLCDATRRHLRPRFPDVLAPPLVYGAEEGAV